MIFLTGTSITQLKLKKGITTKMLSSFKLFTYLGLLLLNHQANAMFAMNELEMAGYLTISAGCKSRGRTAGPNWLKGEEFIYDGVRMWKIAPILPGTALPKDVNKLAGVDYYAPENSFALTARLDDLADKGAIKAAMIKHIKEQARVPGSDIAIPAAWEDLRK